MTEIKESQDLEAVRAALAEFSVVSGPASISLVEIERNQARRDFGHRHLYKVVDNDQTICLAFVGSELEGIREKSDQFAKAFSDLSVKTIGLLRKGKRDVLLSEYFPGYSLEQSVLSGRLSVEETTRIARNLYSTLQGSISDSRPECREGELEAELNAIERNAVFNNYDKSLLKEVLHPRIKEDILSTPLRKIWTNGDFIARNILVSDHGDCKIIDYEFTKETHFYWEDCLRWKTYSEFGKHISLKSLFDDCWEWSSEKEAFFILKQIELESRVACPEALIEGLPHKIVRLRELAGAGFEGFGAGFWGEEIAADGLPELSSRRAKERSDAESSVWKRMLNAFRNRK